eukprot:TRINITY_DN62986_c0_g1_i1.p1 TRINITY_DN62986_c0_g1~~TRINITY_DN62986_c0_g1_i1.p1  ORF type:complete len:354 (+),score=58.90 TRINITY_DN62986_c0_g1_i1:78-1139(+)
MDAAVRQLASQLPRQLCTGLPRPAPRRAAAALFSSAGRPQSLEEFDVDFGTRLGIGAMGAVYPGRHRSTQQPVAIKAVSPALASSMGVVSTREEIADGIAHEREAFRRILDECAGPHPFVVDVLGCFEGSCAEASARGLHLGAAADERRPSASDAAESEDEPIHYFVTERLEGESLQDHIERQKGLDEDEAKRVSRAMCEGIEFLHRNGVVHRDVKPSNVLFSCQALCPDELKLIDFSHAGVGPIGEAAEFDHHLGTAGYVAPEILCQRGTYNDKCDVFSFGCTVHAMLANMRLPRRHARAGIITCLPAGVSAECRSFVDALLAPNPEDRPSAAEALRNPWLKDVPLGLPCRF